jgi:TPR repeat protein
MLSSEAYSAPRPSTSRWSFFHFGAKRAEAAALEERIAALQAELSDCQSRAGIARHWRYAIKAMIAVALIGLGFVLGANHQAIQQKVVDLVPAFGSGVSNIDAGEAAYQKGKYPAALKLVQPLAEDGDPRAESLLGLMYYHGRGLKQDDAQAVKWFRLAADKGNAVAQFNLGVMHAEGQGVPQDYVEAIKWYRRAAEQGEARAQFNLGVSYAEGQGVEHDYVTAYMWFNLAVPRFLPSEADRRRAAINNRDLTASRMSREQIAEAQRLSREWRPKVAEGNAPNATVFRQVGGAP